MCNVTNVPLSAISMTINQNGVESNLVSGVLWKKCIKNTLNLKIKHLFLVKMKKYILYFNSIDFIRQMYSVLNKYKNS